MPITESQVLTELAHHIGRDNGIHVRELVRRITGLQAPNEPMERKVRDIVQALRMEGHHVCAHPAHGYFMAATVDELNATCKYLHDRAMTSLSQVARMKNVSLPDLHGQLHLPT